MGRRIKHQDYKGISLATLIIGAWAINLWYLTTAYPGGYIWFLSFILQVFLNVGLFITAHDSMHGSISPGYPRVNAWLGRIALWLYAGFSYERMKAKHDLHHSFPASAQDPDFARDGDERFWPWFLGFVLHYFGWREFLMMCIPVTFWSFVSGSPLRMFCGFALPAFLSALQLFYFGTYRTHKTPEGGHTHPDRAVSNDFPEWLSLITCYHFGYHQEHHERPSIPWWALPKLRRARLESGAVTQ